MSFGIGVGDFIAVGKLIKDITDCLQSTGGAQSDYRELIIELETLDKALRSLDSIGATSGASPRVDFIKYAAISCRLPLEQFLTKMKRYESSLGIWGRSTGFKITIARFRWALNEKENIQRLQSYLHVHVGTINVLLTEHGLERMNIASEQAEMRHQRVRAQLDAVQTVLTNIDKSASTQTSALGNLQSRLR
jgi:hypothetical protein